MFNKALKETILERLLAIEDRLASDRRAVPVLKEMIKLLTKENKDLKDRLMSKSFQEYQIFKQPDVTLEMQPHFPSTGGAATPEDLDDQFAGDVLNFDKTSNEMVEP